MPSPLAERHIELQARVRASLERSVGTLWTGLGSYDEADIERWLRQVVPVVTAGQAQAVALVDAYLARALERQPLGVDPQEILAVTRNGVAPDEVYRRPFVDVWGGLKDGKLWNEAVALGLERATSAAAIDAQLAMRTAAREIGQADSAIRGYRRVPDAGACEFCVLVAGQTYSTSDLMPVHNRCGCGVEPITDGPPITKAPTGAKGGTVSVAVRDHGELGPLLVNAADNFTAL
jgi:hypothetical protein